MSGGVGKGSHLHCKEISSASRSSNCAMPVAFFEFGCATDFDVQRIKVRCSLTGMLEPPYICTQNKLFLYTLAPRYSRPYLTAPFYG